jgi:hypothetical protein
MKAFVDKYEDRIHGVLSCFDRMLFRGCLPIMSGWSMAQLLQAHEIDCGSVKPFLLANAERGKAHAVALARKHGRPFEYLSAKMRKEDAARKIAERDNIDEGLVCVFSALEAARAVPPPAQPRHAVLRCRGGHELPRQQAHRPLREGEVVAKIPRTRRWRVTDYGRKVMGTTMYLREHHFPNVYAGVIH